MINGNGIESYALVKLRKIIKIVPQEVYYFGETVKEAIDPLNNFTAESILILLEKLEIDLDLGNYLKFLIQINMQISFSRNIYMRFT